MKTKRKHLAIASAAVLSFLLLWLCNVVWDSGYTFGAGDDSIVAAFAKKPSSCIQVEIHVITRGDLIPDVLQKNGDVIVSLGNRHDRKQNGQNGSCDLL
jgi:hypothetical protein